MLKPEDMQMAEAVKSYIDECYAQPITYDMLVTKFRTNKLKLTSAFKIFTKDSLHHYISKIRVEEAKRLLLSDLTIGEIAVRVGLDRSNLNKQFKRMTGDTPTAWRLTH